MPASFLIRHWKKELQVFYKNLFLLQKGSSNPEAIHDLRVSIKKLRSYTKLYSALFNNDRNITCFAETKKLFSVLGRQRNIEISLELIRDFKAKEFIVPVKRHLEFYLKETMQRSKSALRQYKAEGLRSLTIEIERNSGLKDDEEMKAEVRKLMGSWFENVRHLMRDFEKNYHLIRKKLKDLFYWARILPFDFFFSKQELKTVKIILDDLGNSRDCEVLRTNLQRYRKIVLGKGCAEYGHAKKLEENLNQNKHGFLDKAEKMVTTVLKRT